MKTVHIELTPESVDNAVRELERFRKWIDDGVKKLLELIGERGKQYAELEYLSALYTGTNDVSVTYTVTGDVVEIRADGSQVLFIEFGTGVTYPESHPDPLAASYPHGEYGYHLGKNPRGWRFPEGNGDGGSGLAWPDAKHKGYLKTYGSPANASLYNARTQVEGEFMNLVKEAFGTYA